VNPVILGKDCQAHNRMTLNEFVAERRQEIEAFEAFWLEQHGLMPEEFPLEQHIRAWHMFFDADPTDLEYIATRKLYLATKPV